MNKPFITVTSVAILSILTSSCAGKHSSTALPPSSVNQQSLGSNAAGGLQRATPARPFNPLRDHWVRDSTPSLNHDIDTHGPRFPNGFAPGPRGKTTGIHSMATVQTSNNGGFAGTIFSPDETSWWGAYAQQTVYSGFRVNTGDWLYAPTLKGPGHDCLEVSTVYHGSNTPSIGTWDFCIANNTVFHNSKTVDSTFLSAYVRDLGDGLPSYTTETVWSATDTAWHALIFNYNASEWEDMYADSGDGSQLNGEGWSVFETHYYTVGETCPPPPTIKSQSIQLIDTNGNPVYAGGTNSYDTDVGDCFTTSSPYQLSMIQSDYEWTVVQDALPACTIDSYGYCAANDGTVHDGTISCFDGLHWHNYPQTTTTTYSVYGTSGFLETATSTATNSDGGEGNCPQTDTSWDPQEPSQQYSDPNLP